MIVPDVPSDVNTLLDCIPNRSPRQNPVVDFGGHSDWQAFGCQRRARPHRSLPHVAPSFDIEGRVSGRANAAVARDRAAVCARAGSSASGTRSAVGLARLPPAASSRCRGVRGGLKRLALLNRCRQDHREVPSRHSDAGSRLPTRRFSPESVPCWTVPTLQIAPDHPAQDGPGPSPPRRAGGETGPPAGGLSQVPAPRAPSGAAGCGSANSRGGSKPFRGGC